jgi:hypothetical protein
MRKASVSASNPNSQLNNRDGANASSVAASRLSRISVER